MDVHEALYTTRMMRRMRPDPLPLGTQSRILDAAIRAPNGGNTQRWHFLVVDDPDLKRRCGELYRKCRGLEHEEFKTGRKGAPAPTGDAAAHAESLRRTIRSGNYMADHFDDIPLLIFVFAIDDHGGANIYPAIWSALLAARAEGVGGVMTTMMRYVEDTVHDMLGVPVDKGWRLTAMLAFGYPLGKWGVAIDRRPVHEVSSRNRWGAPFGAQVPEPLWPALESAKTDS